MAKHARPAPPVYVIATVVAPAELPVDTGRERPVATAAFNRPPFEVIEAFPAGALRLFVRRFEKHSAVFTKPGGIIAGLGSGREILIALDSRVKGCENAPIIDEESVLFFRMQPVDAGDGLDDFVVFHGFVDIENCVPRFVEAGEQLVDNDQDVGRAVGGKILDDALFVFAWILFPNRPFIPLLDDGEKAGIVVDFLVVLAGIWGRDNDG